ncbi:sugar lactone lactonase YvrE [Rhizobium sp. PP-F2F-G38]|uniref:SMP-30/gluconolactonase/LRE family protein n=1 Tax=Rhizobium sp. PP-CC-3G-465 TaxID=2135648 RepID=UPI000D859453|nr:sugar lactone lactonase YvrE [Rhizobium sp. PP-F2F-G38]TCL88155.1 sugar lactone lactonase YvrE [Rhizobium sp. PP-WC-2G-219]TCQ02817.1 sugar lactone lactonase YvrE [Rhizobium sp. PP-F2F-G36]TCQ15918.1 sugar lactone lactonase YvrE [Rhizobium sp. PP-CC-3G-465]
MRIARFAATVSVIFFLTANLSFGADTKNIEFSGDTIYPESASWSSEQGTFFIGSAQNGSIGTVDMDGNYKTFIRDEALPSTFGIHVDDARDHLWVTVGDLGRSEKSSVETQGKLAAIAVFDSKTGKRLAFYDLASVGPGVRNANDVALDPAGNAYVTDSFAQVIYRIDTTGKLTIFADAPVLKTGDMFGLNGIVYHPDGYLLVGAWNSGEIFRISISDPAKISKVALPETFKGMDGINLTDPNHLVASVNVGEPRAVEIASDDGWTTAKVNATKPAVSTFPSAVAVVGNEAWVLNSRIDSLLDASAEKVDQFILQDFNSSVSK